MTDTPAYKGYGNAVATVCAEYPISNIIEVLKKGTPKMTMNELAAELKVFKDEKEYLAKQTKANNAEIERVEKELSRI